MVNTNSETRTYAQLNLGQTVTVVNEKKKAQHALGTGGHGIPVIDFWEGPARKHAPGHKPQATSAQGTSNKLIGHKPQAWGGSRPQARGSRSLHKVL